MRGIVSGLVLAVPALVAWGSIALAEEPPGRTQVGESHVINSTELKKVRERVDAALAPIALTAVVDPATTQSAGPAIGRVITPVQSATREDGTTVTVMSAWERGAPAPANVGVWHAMDKTAGGLAGMFGGKMGDLVLRLQEPMEGSAARPFGFRRVRLFNDGAEDEYTAEEKGWVLRRYVNSER
jgi:hypothetical protein